MPAVTGNSSRPNIRSTLLSNDGYAWFAVYTNRFSPAQAVGKTVIIHADPDDYRTQPAGNAGARIACGTILA